MHECINSKREECATNFNLRDSKKVYTLFEGSIHTYQTTRDPWIIIRDFELSTSL